MDELEFEIYSEWAENELVWGKGMYNWCRSYIKGDCENDKPFLNYEDKNIEIPF